MRSTRLWLEMKSPQETQGYIFLRKRRYVSGGAGGKTPRPLALPATCDAFVTHKLSLTP